MSESEVESKLQELEDRLTVLEIYAYSHGHKDLLLDSCKEKKYEVLE